jgi:hypothetical protein
VQGAFPSVFSDGVVELTEGRFFTDGRIQPGRTSVSLDVMWPTRCIPTLTRSTRS